MSPHPHNLLVAGSPGAFVHVVNKYLHQKGWAIKWPGQDLDIFNGRFYYEHNGQNCEVQAIHRTICDNHGVSVLSDKLPEFYDLPYPGPAEFIAKFPGPTVISAHSLSPFLDIWQVAAQTVINIVATETDDLKMLKDWTHDRLAFDQLRAIRKTYLDRYNRHLKLFPRVFTMTNAEIVEKHFDALGRFLTSNF
jgi:hypothetical protein